MSDKKARTRQRILGAASAALVRRGPLQPGVAGVMESASDRRRYAETIGYPLTVCRLVVPLPHLQERLTAQVADHLARLPDRRPQIAQSG